jgi:hypothetical protein
MTRCTASVFCGCPSGFVGNGIPVVALMLWLLLERVQHCNHLLYNACKAAWNTTIAYASNKSTKHAVTTRMLLRTQRLKPHIYSTYAAAAAAASADDVCVSDCCCCVVRHIQGPRWTLCCCVLVLHCRPCSFCCCVFLSTNLCNGILAVLSHSCSVEPCCLKQGHS